MRLYTYILLLLLFTSCYTQRRATRQVTHAAMDQPAVLAQICQNRFPIIPTVRVEIRDSIIRDTIPGLPVLIDCADEDNVGKAVKVPCPDIPLVHHYHSETRDSVWEDTRRIFLLEAQMSSFRDSCDSALNYMNNARAQTHDQLELTQGKLSKRNKQLIWAIIIILGGALITILKIYTKIQFPKF